MPAIPCDKRCACNLSKTVLLTSHKASCISQPSRSDRHGDGSRKRETFAPVPRSVPGDAGTAARTGAEKRSALPDRFQQLPAVGNGQERGGGLGARQPWGWFRRIRGGSFCLSRNCRQQGGSSEEREHGFLSGNPIWEKRQKSLLQVAFSFLFDLLSFKLLMRGQWCEASGCHQTLRRVIFVASSSGAPGVIAPGVKREVR
jgi:hypothetical protein